MNLDVLPIAIAIAVGVGATLVMDAWAIVASRLFAMPSTNYCIVGRWLCYMPEGVFRHASIGATPSKPPECTVGWAAHYVIGALYAVALVLLASPRWLQEPTLMPAMVLGLVTVAIPLLVMQPSFGLGIASSKTPNPTQARLRSVMNHAVFGLGLYLSALVIRFVLASLA